MRPLHDPRVRTRLVAVGARPDVGRVYRHCLHCARDLGRNRDLGTLPVGRRIVFDPARGRLWVACTRCARWSLVPAEDRWETLERCEALFTSTRLRHSTAHVGLARLPGGTELVRIGERAPGDEIAAWRYGERFASRRRRALWGLSTSGAIGVLGAVGIALPEFVAPLFMGLGGTTGCRRYERCDPGTNAFALLMIGAMATSLAIGGLAIGLQRLLLWRTVARVRLSTRRTVPVSFAVADRALVTGWSLATLRIRIPIRVQSLFDLVVAPADDPGPSARTFEGDDARRLLRAILPLHNDAGADAAAIAHARAHLERHPSADAILDAMYVGPRAHRPDHLGRAPRGPFVPEPRLTLDAEPPHVTLALEMALEAEDEARWLAGEAAALERHWREAEEVAAIADRLLLPASVTARAAALRREAGRHDGGDDPAR